MDLSANEDHSIRQRLTAKVDPGGLSVHPLQSISR